ncbi:MAG TPA: c-type cytochrome biogenesis protein CcsB [Propionibacteriaceae bacterium]|nr:c-type cytochrome biogenesis protein CcsB [Propionibacteriaceae bacterium]
MTVASFSALAVVTAAVLYLLALSLHALEWAMARHVEVSAASVATGAKGGVAVLDKPSDAAVRPAKADMYGRMGLSITILAAAVNVAGIVARGIAAHRAPWGNMYEFITTAAVVVAALYLLGVWRWHLRWLGLPVTLLGAVLNGLAATVFYVAVAPLVPALHSVWFMIHILAAIISGAAFSIGGVAAILYLVVARAERRGTVKGYLAMLPGSDGIDRISYRVLAFAFPLWTFTIAAGAIWAEYAWGRYWGWDPKETWSLVAWVVFAGYLHARATAGWRGTRAAWLAILGFALFWWNFIGVNLVFAGLHSYAGI